MKYEPKNYDNLIGTEGFSETLLKNHFTLYEGYVKNTNKASEALNKLEKASPEYAEVKRRFGWEFNGMRLHEYYFGNMKKGGSELDKDSELFKNLKDDFSSYDNWAEDFKAVGGMRGIGWVIFYHDPLNKRFFNVWINEHDVGHLAGGTPLLVLDVFEHAFVLDYGLKKADYIEAFFKAIDWGEVTERFSKSKK